MPSLSDALLLSSSTATALLLVASAARTRSSRRRSREPGDGDIQGLLGKPFKGLAQGPPCKNPGVETSLSHLIAPKGFEGKWRCCRLGCGGWGCAYRCERPGEASGEKREVVFKTPKGYEAVFEAESAGLETISEKVLGRIVELATALQRLQHPHILRLLGYSTKAPIIVYEYASQGSLEWQLSQGWSPSLRETVLLGAQLADALRYIHSRGLVHGDVKPGNIFFADGVAKLGDFSSTAKLLARTTSLAEVRGYTPGFRAPEQVYSDLARKTRQLGYENRIDTYQLANTLLYTATGDTVDGEEAVDEKTVEEKLAKLPSKKLADILREALKPEPWKRPSAEELERKLANIYYT